MFWSQAVFEWLKSIASGWWNRQRSIVVLGAAIQRLAAPGKPRVTKARGLLSGRIHRICVHAA